MEKLQEIWLLQKQDSLRKACNLRNKILLELAKCKHNSKKEPRKYMLFSGQTLGQLKCLTRFKKKDEILILSYKAFF